MYDVGLKVGPKLQLATQQASKSSLELHVQTPHLTVSSLKTLQSNYLLNTEYAVVIILPTIVPRIAALAANTPIVSSSRCPALREIIYGAKTHFNASQTPLSSLKFWQSTVWPRFGDCKASGISRFSRPSRD